MKALRQKLQKHAVTRQWVGLDSDKQALSQDEQELRQELEWQQNVTDALTSYGKVLETATYSLLEAHQSLMDLHLELLTPEAAAMHRALRCLVAQLRHGAEANSTPLGLHVAQLQGCMAKVKEVDEARALQKHYEDKVVQLDEEVKRKSSPALQSKLERNQEKLQQASVASQNAQEVAHESLQQCAARRQNLQRIAGSFMTSLSKAFQAAVSSSSRSMASMASTGSSGYAVANVPPDGLNPFTEDVLREATPVAKDPVPPTASNPFPDSDSASGAESGPPDPGKWKPLESESENSTSPWAQDPKPQPEGLESLEGDPK